MASDDFNKASTKTGWQLYGAASGFTTSIGLGVFGLAMYMKPEASGWWLLMGIMGVLGTVGSAYNFYSLVKQDMNAHKPPSEHKQQNTHDNPPPPPGPQP